MRRSTVAWVAVGLLTAACSGGRYLSADADLEEIYRGKTYYEVTDDFGRPDATLHDGMEGTKVAYNFVSLNGTRAASLYEQHHLRNRITKTEGTPSGGITFSFDANMCCYAVDSDFQRQRTKQDKVKTKALKDDVRRPMHVKPRIPRTLDYPYFEGTSPFAENVSLERVEVERDYTKVYFTYKRRTPRHQSVVDDGLYIMPDVYIENCTTGERYALTEHTGITLYPYRTYFAQNQGGYDVLAYSLTFEPVAEETEFINIVEPGHSGYNFYRVDIRTPMTDKSELKQQR